MSHPALDDVLRATAARRAGDGWLGRCLGHDDKSPSLSIADRDGKILLNCQTGCSWETLRGAFASRGIEIGTPRDGQRTERVWTIRDADGKALAQHVRVDNPDGSKAAVFWRGPNGEKRGLREMGLSLFDLPLYGIDQVPEQATDVFVTEGEKAADALRSIGLVAVGTSTGADVKGKGPSAQALADLKGRRAILWPDHDEPGAAHMRAIADRLKGLGVESITLAWPGARAKGDDAADFVARGGRAPQVLELVAAAEVGGGSGPKLRRLSDGIDEAIAEMARYERGDFSDRLSTGLPSLNRKIRGGLKGGEVTLVGAPSGGGKTTLVVQLCVEAARKGPVLLVSPEMGVLELAEREIVRRSRNTLYERAPWNGEPSHIRDMARSAHEHAAKEIRTERLPLWVMDDPELDYDMALVEQAARSVRGLRLLAIDYAQEMAQGADPKTPRYLQVGSVGQRSVSIARKLGIPVVVASQVNVTNEKGGSRSYSFRETSILEHKAHNVLILDVEWDTSDPQARRVSKAEIICRKQRSGAAFTLRVDYDPSTYSIRDAQEKPHEDYSASYLAPLPRA
jgi:hypothetical protein